jgi:hypothetical protein
MAHSFSESQRENFSPGKFELEPPAGPRPDLVRVRLEMLDMLRTLTVVPLCFPSALGLHYV